MSDGILLTSQCYKILEYAEEIAVECHGKSICCLDILLAVINVRESVVFLMLEKCREFCSGVVRK